MRHATTVLAILALAVTAGAGDAAAQSPSTRWGSVVPGAHRVGFEVRVGLDAERRINTTEPGTRIGLAIWYPAQRSAATAALTTLDYRLLTSGSASSAAERRSIEEDEIAALLGWRHVGIVEMTRDQARASLATGGLATRDATPAAGRFPVVVILGGQYYLATTAEILASHGFLVVAPFRFADQVNEVGTAAFTSYLENGVRDAEWAMAQLDAHSQADLRSMATLGHGGGGMQALLLAMRNRRVTAVTTLDASIFSARSGTRDVPFFGSRLVRVPYLNIATASTRKGEDRFDDFLAMTFSDRYQVVLETPDLRHHDLSDLGRGVTAPLSIRGASQVAVEEAYARSHEMIVRFLQEQASPAADRGRYGGWLRAQASPGRVAVTLHPGREPTPAPAAVLGTLGPRTADTIRKARLEDPEAPLLQPDALARLVGKALDAGALPVARAVSDAALEIHPDHPLLLDYGSRALERLGERDAAHARAARCAALGTTGDWRAAAAIARCAALAERLSVR